MDNMGGLNRLYYIDADDFVSLVKGIDDLYTLTLDQGKAPHEIVFTQDTGKISETESDNDNGVIYNYEASVKVPKCSVDNNDLLGEYRQKKLLILGEDNNENLWLTGDPGSYFDIGIINDTGTNSQDMNGSTLKISASLAKGSVFINPLS
jgi:DNA-binding beta-propeller fold protein YncE